MKGPPETPLTTRQHSPEEFMGALHWATNHHAAKYNEIKYHEIAFHFTAIINTFLSV